jgi:hypothetical protein
VLDLVISSTCDAVLLCKASEVSTYFRDLALTHIKQHLAQLLVHTIKEAAKVRVISSVFKFDYTSKQQQVGMHARPASCNTPVDMELIPHTVPPWQQSTLVCYQLRQLSNSSTVARIRILGGLASA